MLDSITKIVSGPIMQHKLNQRMGIEINISKKTNDLGQFKKVLPINISSDIHK